MELRQAYHHRFKLPRFNEKFGRSGIEPHLQALLALVGTH